MDGGVEWLAMHEASAVAPLASRCDAAARSAEKATAPIGSGGATVPASAWAQW